MDRDFNEKNAHVQRAPLKLLRDSVSRRWERLNVITKYREQLFVKLPGRDTNGREAKRRISFPMQSRRTK